MPVQSYVVAFPSAFSRRHITALARNIRRVLRVQNEPYASVRRDGDILLVDAHDPVFASAAVGLLFGVDRTLIARRVENDFERVVAAISEVGGNLLLAGDRFLVRVEGHTRGFLPPGRGDGRHLLHNRVQGPGGSAPGDRRGPRQAAVRVPDPQGGIRLYIRGPLYGGTAPGGAGQGRVLCVRYHIGADVPGDHAHGL